MKNITTTNKNNPNLSVAVALILSFFAITNTVSADTATTSAMTSVVTTSTTATTTQNNLLTTNTGIIFWPAIKAESAIVYDPISAKVLYEKDADSVRPIASIAKIMTASIADDILNWPGKKSVKPIKIIKGPNGNEADITLKTGTYWVPADLVKYMLIGSSNKAAESIASSLVDRRVFMSLMNHQASEWGLTHTYFTNPSGLGIALQTNTKVSSTSTQAEQPGAVSTARETALMMWHIVENHLDLLDPTHDQLALFGANNTSTIAVKNTNKILSDLPIIFGKTGFTTQAGGNLAVVIQKNPTSHPYIIVVLNSTVDDRYTDVEALAKVTQSVIEYQH